MEPQIPIPIDAIEDFCKDHHIAKLALFGSILTEHFSDNSDINVLVEFEADHTPTLFGIVKIEEELSAIVGRKVDLRTLQDLSCYFRDDVISGMLQVYGEEEFKSA